MIKIHPTVREVVLKEIEAYYALSAGFMNMSSYAYRIRPQIEAITKKQVTINSLVVSLSRLRKELKKGKPLLEEVKITNITTKLPLSEVTYENTSTIITSLDRFYEKVPISREDFFTSTVGTSELTIVCSSHLIKKVLKHFPFKPKIVMEKLAAIGISFGPEQIDIPNTIFSLMSIPARARINILEIVSTYTELIFVVSEKDFPKTVGLFSELHHKG